MTVVGPGSCNGAETQARQDTSPTSLICFCFYSRLPSAFPSRWRKNTQWTSFKVGIPFSGPVWLSEIASVPTYDSRYVNLNCQKAIIKQRKAFIWDQKLKCEPWLVWLNGLSASLRSKGLLIQFLVREYAWVAGQVPQCKAHKGNHTLMFLSLSFFLPSPLSQSKIKYIFF